MPRPASTARPVHRVSFDSRAVTLDDQRLLLISGEIHYVRSPRALWPELLDRSVAAGLNCIACYVFWNVHEPDRDVYDFVGDRDVGHFLGLCAERKLHVILRVGPYCCAEWNFGGFPAYLRDEPGITLRTWNRPYVARAKKYFRRLLPRLRPYFASNGGPVILVQVENEYANVARRYGEAGQRYIAWIVGFAKSLGVDVPAITCEGGAPGAIECLNGFSIPAERIAQHRAAFPDQPLIWTELWPAWYDTWGYEHHRRDERNIGYWILDFLGRGGTGWNYYMWHGGTNFGRTAMYLQTTSYDFDAPLDEYGRATRKSTYLQELHAVIRAHAPFFLEGTRVRRGNRTTWRHGRRTLTLVTDPVRRTARLRDRRGRVLLDTSPLPSVAIPRWRTIPMQFTWRRWNEPIASERTGVVRAPQPIEQLKLTRDRSDYCWYSTTIEVVDGGEQMLDIALGGDLFHVFCDDRLVASSRPPFRENRGPTVPPMIPAPAQPAVNPLEKAGSDDFRHRFVFRAPRGRHRLNVLAVAVGLVKGDWQISGPMDTERKGIWGAVRLNGCPLSRWEMRPGLVGEAAERRSRTRALSRSSRPRSCTWFSARFRLPIDATADYRLDAAGLGKGLLYLNGRLLGRHWLIRARGYGADEGWHLRERDGLTTDRSAEPTQRHYHVPRAWFGTENELVIFEEQPCLPLDVKLQARRHS